MPAVVSKQPAEVSPAVVEQAAEATPQNATQEAAEVEVEGDQSESKEASPVVPSDIYELFDTEEKAQTMLAFVLDDLLSYQDEIQLMLKECKNSVEVALDVVPRMTHFVETTMRRGLRNGVFKDEDDETQDDEKSELMEEEEVVRNSGPAKAQQVKEGEDEDEGEASQNDDEDDDELDGDQSSLESNEEKKEAEVVSLEDTTYDHIALDLKAFLSICAQFCMKNKQSPLHQQLMLFEKKFIPFKKDATAVGFK